MTQDEKRLWLIRYLLGENVHYRNTRISEDISEQKDMLRALMNVRMPMPVTEEFLEIQDSYLQTENESMGYVSIDDMTPCKRDDRLYIWQGDITRLSVEAIVNAANSSMLGCFQPLHSCIDNCIHTYAGIQMRAECHRQMNNLRIKYGRDYEQPTAVPMLTPGYNLPARNVIHVVGPIVNYGLSPELEKELSDCYKNTLNMCAENSLKSVAFCCISTGVFHFPNQRAAEIAVNTVTDWMNEHEDQMERVIFNVFKDEDKEYYEQLLFL